jgi:GNAT superfamily N-acetyltransferase
MHAIETWLRHDRCVSDEILIRPAEPADAAGVADTFLAAFGETYEFPLAHDDDEVREWVATRLLPTTTTWVALADGAVVGFLALRDEVIEQLYVRRPWTGQGIGSALMALAKQRSPAELQLWTFQVNAGARRFYERHGFVPVELTDGATNQERQPDVRYRWVPRSIG